MALFGKLFAAPKAESLALIEVGADSVAGAYVRLTEGALPHVVYNTRISLEMRVGEAHEAALGRALNMLGDALIKQGAPLLQRATGSGSTNSVLASIAAPWQDAVVRVEKVESPKAFTFTHSILRDALARSSTVAAGKLLVDEAVIATMLNGYETHQPLGKKVERASIVILASSVDAAIGTLVTDTMRTLYHTHDTKLTAFARVAYEGLRTAFPHEEEYLALEVRGGVTTLMLIKRDCLVGVATLPPSDGGWLPALTTALGALAEENPLPHTIFLLAGDTEREELKQAIEGAHFDTLWLSEGPPRVLALTPELLAPFVGYAPEAKSDLFISLLVLFCQHAVYS